jgi:hypothetical protein
MPHLHESLECLVSTKFFNKCAKIFTLRQLFPHNPLKMLGFHCGTTIALYLHAD